MLTETGHILQRLSPGPLPLGSLDASPSALAAADVAWDSPVEYAMTHQDLRWPTLFSAENDGQQFSLAQGAWSRGGVKGRGQGWDVQCTEPCSIDAPSSLARKSCMRASLGSTVPPPASDGTSAVLLENDVSRKHGGWRYDWLGNHRQEDMLCFCE